MKKIIHISDLHIGFKNMRERFQDIVDNLISTMQPASDYAIVLTGDLVEKPEDNKFYQQAKDTLDRLDNAGFRTFIAPGNHDYNGGFTLSKKLAVKFREFFFGDSRMQYPHLEIVDNMAFIGLDSMADELHWYDSMFADGELGDPQLERLDALLNDSTVKACEYRVVYLHHHPFNFIPFSELKDSRKLRKILQKHGNIDALLFGHHHMGYRDNGHWDIPRCYEGGTATGKLPGKAIHRIIDLSQPPGEDQEAKTFDFDD